MRQYQHSFVTPPMELRLYIPAKDFSIESRSFVIEVDAKDAAGDGMPRGALAWPYSDSLESYYRYLPATAENDVAVVAMEFSRDFPVGQLIVGIRPWSAAARAAGTQAMLGEPLLTWKRPLDAGGLRAFSCTSLLRRINDESK